MGMVVRTNTMSVNAYRQLGQNNSAVSKSLEKLSSGFRINRAGDDASGLAISEKMKAQINGLEQASTNSQDGISLIQTAEGATTEIHNMLGRMITLATKSANGTIQDEVDRDAIQTEVDALKTEITRIAKATNFNGIDLLNGNLSGGSVDAKLATKAGDTITGVKTAAVAFTGTLTAADVNDDEISITYKNEAGDDVTLSATFTGNATTGGEGALAALEAVSDYEDFAELYDAKADGMNITITAKNAGKSYAVTGDIAAATPDATTALGSLTSGANAKSTITLNAALANEDKITVGGKTYTKAAAADPDKNEFATAADLIAQAGKNGYTVTIATDIDGAGDTIVFEEDKAGKGLKLQVGDTNAEFNHVTVSIDDLTAKGLGIEDLDVSTQDAAGNTIDVIKAAINKVSTNRGNLGALQNRLEYTINNLDTTAENMTSANSRIRDTDMAKEMMNYTKMNILTQAAQSMLAQANQQPQQILQLLQ